MRSTDTKHSLCPLLGWRLWRKEGSRPNHLARTPTAPARWLPTVGLMSACARNVVFFGLVIYDILKTGRGLPHLVFSGFSIGV